MIKVPEVLMWASPRTIVSVFTTMSEEMLRLELMYQTPFSQKLLVGAGGGEQQPAGKQSRLVVAATVLDIDVDEKAREDVDEKLAIRAELLDVLPVAVLLVVVPAVARVLAPLVA
jgi:hypothetical protein